MNTELFNDGEIKLINLLKNLSQDNTDIKLANIITFRNNILLAKSNMDSDDLNNLLLKNYLLLLFSDNKINPILKDYLLNSDIITTIEMINNDINIKYYLSYLLVNYIKDKNSINISNTDIEDYESIKFIIEKINNSIKQSRFVRSKKNTHIIL